MILQFLQIFTMGAKRSTRQVVVKTEYIPFEKVLKSNYLLNEQVKSLTYNLHEAHKKNLEYEVTILEYKDEIAKFKEWQVTQIEEQKNMKNTVTTLSEMFDNCTQAKNELKELRQQNLKLKREQNRNLSRQSLVHLGMLHKLCTQYEFQCCE